MTLRFGLIALMVLSGTMPGLAQEDGAKDDGAVYSVPSTMCRGFFFVPVTLKSKSGSTRSDEERTLHLLYDTGASSTYVDPESLERVSGTRLDAGKRVTIRDATAGDVKFNKLGARLSQMDHISAALGRELDGILAFDTFRKFLLTLDYTGEEMRLTEGTLPKPDNVEIFSSKGRDKRPWVTMTLGGKRKKILIDSGSNTSIAVKGLKSYKTFTAPVAISGAARFNRLVTNYGARLDGEARFGSYEIENPIVLEATGSELMGYPVLKHFTWIFDQKNRRMRIVKTTDGPITSDPVKAPGLFLVSTDDGFRIDKIFEHGPAAETDLRLGDVITHIDGRPALRRGCDENADAISITYTIRRGDAEMDVTVPLLPPLVE